MAREHVPHVTRALSLGTKVSAKKRELSATRATCNIYIYRERERERERERVILRYPPKKGGVRYPLVGNLLHQVTFFSYLTISFSHCTVSILHMTVLFSHLMVPSSHCAILASHMTVLFSHLVVPLLFSHI